ncbi:RNA polymerase sigma-70 factor [Marinifilum sp. D714]|uniref:RNA polymerase sigma-70 factor n=1 Tax=Marinifilum sp. D714 TaxID=2937523 RepID=UPI0027C62D25|nr:RNA polymerase sigma-70 factor [Marinifilum sp. D714]MDQ2180452.1 RNA polymerase sigma-70 factor [Marinifilum sp. D714]
MSNFSAISNAFKDHYPSLILYALKWMKNEDLAKDLVQAVFVNLLEKSENKRILDYRTYLFKSVRNECIQYFRKNSPQNSIEELDQSVLGYFNDPIEQAEFEAYVFSLIDKLPPATKNIFKLNRFEGLSNQQIADQLKISKRTVELQISNALKHLRQELIKSRDKNHNFSQFLYLLF